MGDAAVNIGNTLLGRVESHVPRPEGCDRIALVLQGGGALGAYQAGVYQALHEAGIEPDWISGVSIGAINGTIIAGNPPELRLQKLRTFWERITERKVWNYTPDGDLPQARNAASRGSPSRRDSPASLHRAIPAHGSPLPAPRTRPATMTARPCARLLELVDFSLIKEKAVRLRSARSTCSTATSSYFDNARMVGPGVMASGACRLRCPW